MRDDFMNLKLCTYSIKDVVFDESDGITDGILRIDKKKIEGKLTADSSFDKVYIDIARPGEMVRIIHVLDIIQPRAKFNSDLRIFPGFLGPPISVGRGTTHKLENVAVVTTGDFQAFKSNAGPSSVETSRERVIDMAGEAAIFSPFSETINVVLNVEPAQNVSMVEFDDAVRRAGLWVAEYLAQLTADVKPDQMDRLHLSSSGDNDMPKIAYIYQLQSHGFLRNTYFYGERLTYQQMPTLVHPNEIMDGAVVNASLAFASFPTYVHQNNRVISGLYEKHGKEIIFLGVILLTYHKETNVDKTRKAHFAAKLAKMLGADGIVSTQEGGGNSMVDQMLTVKFCEEMGIKTVAITLELGGIEGTDFPLIYQVDEADALVSTGNREQIVRLPKMEKVIGGTHFLYKDVSATEPYDIYMSDIAFSIDQSGYWKVRAWDY